MLNHFIFFLVELQFTSYKLYLYSHTQGIRISVNNYKQGKSPCCPNPSEIEQISITLVFVSLTIVGQLKVIYIQVNTYKILKLSSKMLYGGINAY